MPAVSIFSDLLEENSIDPDDFEPDEITWLCSDRIFRTIAEYCARSRGWLPPSKGITQTFDADELGIDPEDFD